MKTITPLTLVAILFLAGCSNSTDGTVSESDPIETTDNTEEAYLQDLTHLSTELTEDELTQAGHEVCDEIKRNQGQSEEVTGKNISDKVFWYMVTEESDADNANAVVRAAVYNFCPEMTDQFDYEAMRSGPFYDDFREELRELHVE